MVTDTTLNNTPTWLVVFSVVAAGVIVCALLLIYLDEMRLEVAKTLPEMQTLTTLHRAIVSKYPVQDVSELRLERKSKGLYVHESSEQSADGARVYDRTIVTCELCGNVHNGYYDNLCERTRRVITVAQEGYELALTVGRAPFPLILTVADEKYEIESIPYYFRCFANNKMPTWAQWILEECPESRQRAFQILRSALETLNASG